jgi:hypothetical protein
MDSTYEEIIKDAAEKLKQTNSNRHSGSEKAGPVPSILDPLAILRTHFFADLQNSPYCCGNHRCGNQPTVVDSNINLC